MGADSHAKPYVGSTTLSWSPGLCREEFVVSLLVSGKWIEIGRTTENHLDVVLRNTVNQPYGVSAICGGS